MRVSEEESDGEGESERGREGERARVICPEIREQHLL